MYPHPDPRLASYSIGAASRETGIAAETLRKWERRYGVPRPVRRASGQRTYDAAEVDRLRLVARAVASGHRPSDVVSLSREALEKLEQRSHAPDDLNAEGGAVPTPSACLEALRRDDAVGLSLELRHAALLFGPLRFVSEVAQPLTLRVGKLWETGELDVRQEHLFSYCLSTQLRLLVSTLEGSGRRPVVILTTFPGELHALGIDMAAVHIAARGGAPRLLGPSLPPREIAAAARAHHADVIGVSISAASSRAQNERHLRALVAVERTRRIWLGGAGALSLRTPESVRVIDGWRSLAEAISTMRS